MQLVFRDDQLGGISEPEFLDDNDQPIRMIGIKLAILFWWLEKIKLVSVEHGVLALEPPSRISRTTIAFTKYKLRGYEFVEKDSVKIASIVL